MPGYKTGDIIKGSITIDPDGYPLLYTGSRDNFFHVVALDREQPTALWKLSAYDTEPTLWNNDWDGSALVIDDYLLLGGENSRFYVVKLNRSYDSQGQVTVDPVVVVSVAGWDDQLLEDIRDVEVSIEGSVAISESVVYFANSGGLVQGWDLAEVPDGKPANQVFRFWTGDDTDASIVIDKEGMLYVAAEQQRFTDQAARYGQVFKLDPSKVDDPVVWSHEGATDATSGGVYATPALALGLVIVPTDDGRVLALNQDSGALQWTLNLPGPLWSSPVIVDGVLIQGDCTGGLHAYDLTHIDVRNGVVEPRRLWTVTLGGCIESTPAVWDGRIYVGSRKGEFVAVE